MLEQDNTGKIRTLQGARFLFAVFIFISHCATPTIEQGFNFGGESGVAFFFVLSGFALSWGYGPRISRGEFSAKQFFWRHFWRLYPLHLLLWTITLLADMRIGLTYDWLQIASSLLLLQSWIPSMHTLFTVNALSWFLCNIIFFYVVFGWLYKWLIHVRLKPLFIGMAAYCALYLIVAAQVPDDMFNCTLYANPLLRLFDFGLGILTYRIYKTKACKEPAPTAVAGNSCGSSSLRYVLLRDALLLVGLYVLYQQLPQGVRCAAPFWLVMPLLVYDMVRAQHSRELLVRFFSSKVMMWLGGISFEFYLSHTFMLRISQHVVGFDGTLHRDMLMFFVAFCLAIVVGGVLHYGFVRPVSNVINRHFLH